jgi:hypothetical protein
MKAYYNSVEKEMRRDISGETCQFMIIFQIYIYSNNIWINDNKFFVLIFTSDNLKEKSDIIFGQFFHHSLVNKSILVVYIMIHP